MNTRPPMPDLVARRRPNTIAVTAAACLYIAVMAIAVPALQDPERVDRLVIDNPHPWSVHVHVTGTDHDTWLGIGTVERDRPQTFRSVIHQGDNWTIAFAYSGIDVEVSLTAFQLDQRSWRITVPDEFADELRAARVPETPP